MVDRTCTCSQHRYHGQDKNIMPEVYLIALQYTSINLVPPAALKGNYIHAYVGDVLYNTNSTKSKL